MDSSSQVWDNLDVDLVVKVLANTAFSPVFVFFIPIFYWFQGYSWFHGHVVVPAIYCAAITTFWGLRWYSRLFRNQASLIFGPPPLDWGEQLVVITGGASGIGELLANTLAVRNVTVAVLDTKPIETENFNIEYYQCDVSKWEEVEAVHKKIVEELGDPTIIVNNAGVVQGKLILDLKPEDIKQTFDVNTLAHFWTLKAFLPAMIKKKSGHIVTVSSIMGTIGACGMSDYSASKAALFSLHESLRYELDKKYNAPGVRTTLLAPGLIQTPMFSRASFPRSRLFKFFVPPLPPITVVKSIIAALDECHSRTIFLPFYANFAPFVHTLPSFLRDPCQWLSGADNAMDGFVKVSGRRAEEGPAPAQLNGHSSLDDGWH